MGASSSKVSQTASKAATQASSTAANAARSGRQYPTSPSPATKVKSSNEPSQYPHSAPSQVHPDTSVASPADLKKHYIELDGRDPQFASSLRKLGPAVEKSQGTQSGGVASAGTGPFQTFPTSSHPPVGQQGSNIFPSRSPATNSSLLIVQAREAIAKRWEDENENLGRGSFAGRTLISAKDLTEAIQKVERGRSQAEVEKQRRLKPGILGELGKGVVASTNY